MELNKDESHLEIRDKKDYVKLQTQTRDHHCHWPGCNKQVPPAMWGCYEHWIKLPKFLRNELWQAYRPGQEIDKRPSKHYIFVARKIQRWIKENFFVQG